MRYTVAFDVAKKYATAFLHSFAGQLTAADIKNIERAQKNLHDQKKTLFFLQLPQFTQDVRVSMIEDLVHYFSLPQSSIRLFLLLVAHNRAFLLPDVLASIVVLYKEQHNQMDFSVTSAHSLDEKQKTTIKKFLDYTTSKDNICTFTTNKNLIAGIRAQSVSYLWEYSVRNQLRCLRTLEK